MRISADVKNEVGNAYFPPISLDSVQRANGTLYILTLLCRLSLEAFRREICGPVQVSFLPCVLFFRGIS